MPLIPRSRSAPPVSLALQGVGAHGDAAGVDQSSSENNVIGLVSL
jgi:hypothetical protein